MKFILDNTDNDYVVSIKIGETASEDRQNGFRMPVWDQIAIACDIITNDPNLKDGYHGLGLSQGSQFLRLESTVRYTTTKYLLSIKISAKISVLEQLYKLVRNHKW